MIDKLLALPSLKNSGAFDVWLTSLASENRAIIEPALTVLQPLFCASPYLLDLANKHEEFLAQILQQAPEKSLVDILGFIQQLSSKTIEEAQIFSLLRQAKGQVALLCAICETGQVWSSKRAAVALSDFADTSLQAALEFAFGEAQRQGKFKQDISPIRAKDSGICILALGKHGGRELNYSSDIDVVAFFDPQSNIFADPDRASKIWSRIIQRTAAIMQERTANGYVFRTDLRLRPDPGSTPVALSVDGALAYYESRGQNWERAAWIKARAVAGDFAVAKRFLSDLAPFIWRKHLDFAAIADIQAMKRQINMAQNIGEECLAGHNVKLGRGGIREIEFFAQTQQLIAGGREPQLRVIPTTIALEKLAQNNWIDQKTSDEMSKAYWFLRGVENRLQMLNDEQTHILPAHDKGLQFIAVLMGYDNLDEFEQAYRKKLQIVTANYIKLFSGKTQLSSEAGSLVFTGTDDDPATLETLAMMGFSDPVAALATIKKWHYGSYAATRAAASRAHLTELLPVFLQTMAKAGSADMALQRFDDFLSRLPTGVQLFAMLGAHPQLCQLLLAFMASAPRMAEAVITRAHVLDGMIDPARTAEIINPQILMQKIETFLAEASGFEDVIERARLIGQEQKFLISAGLISGTISPELAGSQFSVLAQTLFDRLFIRVRDLFEQRHGIVVGANIALLAFGRLGSWQMNVASDLDVILLFEAPSEAENSNGEKPLEKGLYFTRLTQRLITAISAQTANGVLYEVDMRLRPSGNAGPLATSRNAFVSYQKEKAWTWEHMALTRSRVIYGDGDFGRRIETDIAQVFARKGNKIQVLKDAVSMRQRLLKERSPRHEFDLKLMENGLMDIEFIAQTAVILYPDLLVEIRRDVQAILRTLEKENLLAGGEILAQHYSVMCSIIQIVAACLSQPFATDSWNDAFKELLAQLTNFPSFEHLQTHVEEMRREVKQANSDWFC